MNELERILNIINKDGYIDLGDNIDEKQAVRLAKIIYKYAMCYKVNVALVLRHTRNTDFPPFYAIEEVGYSKSREANKDYELIKKFSL